MKTPCSSGGVSNFSDGRVMPKDRLVRRRGAVSFVSKEVVQPIQVERGFGAIQRILCALHVASAILQFFQRDGGRNDIGMGPGGSKFSISRALSARRVGRAPPGSGRGIVWLD